MQKYRVLSEARLTQAVEAYSKQQLEKQEDGKGVVERFGDDVERMQQAVETTGAAVVEGLADMKDKAVNITENTAGTAGMILEATTDNVGSIAKNARASSPSQESADQK